MEFITEEEKDDKNEENITMNIKNIDKNIEYIN